MSKPSVITVTTAVKLSSEQLEKVAKEYKKQTGNTVKVETIVDPAVIGGIKITAGSTQVDGTIQNKLKAIRNQLLNI